MKNKQITFTLLCLFFIAFLTSGCVDSHKMNQLDNEVSRLNQVIQQKDAEISSLVNQSQAKQQELDSIKKELDSIKKELESAKREVENLINNLAPIKKTPVVPQQ